MRGWFFKLNSNFFGVVENHWDTEQWEMSTLMGWKSSDFATHPPLTRCLATPPKGAGSFKLLLKLLEREERPG